jgi:hypothetical protein
MKRTWALLILLVFGNFCAWSRILDLRDVKTMMATSKLVFVGRTKAAAWSGIHTRLTYPTWEKVDFEWQRVECEVLEPIKGCKKGDIVQVAMLSVSGTDQPMINAPSLIDPKDKEMRLFFLQPTPVANLFASLNAPYDDALAILPLDRNYWECESYRKRDDKRDPSYERGKLIWSLVNDSGELLPDGVTAMRKQYKRQIKSPPKKNEMIYLEWESVTNQAGWFSDVPKGLPPSGR